LRLPRHDEGACYNALPALVDARASYLLELARHLGANPNYSFLNSYAPEGGLDPSWWAANFLHHWLDAEWPAPLPSHGSSVEVQGVRGGVTPVATVVLRPTP
jgi:hypothetical protein